MPDAHLEFPIWLPRCYTPFRDGIAAIFPESLGDCFFPSAATVGEFSTWLLEQREKDFATDPGCWLPDGHRGRGGAPSDGRRATEHPADVARRDHPRVAKPMEISRLNPISEAERLLPGCGCAPGLPGMANGWRWAVTTVASCDPDRVADQPIKVNTLYRRIAGRAVRSLHFAVELNNAILTDKPCIQHQSRANLCAAVAFAFGQIRMVGKIQRRGKMMAVAAQELPKWLLELSNSFSYSVLSSEACS